MIQDAGLRWLVTLLFVFSAAVCVRGSVAGRHAPVTLISHLLHAVMAVAMAVMAAGVTGPRGADLPTRAPMIFFAAAALWFAVLIATGGAHRLANGYHTIMMTAMAWMYAVMGALPLPRATAQSTVGSAMEMTSTAAGHGGHGGHASHSAGHAGAEATSWVGVLNLLCALGFTAAATFWFYRFVTSRLQGEPESAGRTLGILCQLAMAAGMAVMFAVLV
ncbi:MAG: DUF5134 domain-containing protein [Mycobacterium sp.]|nr:DUF5134 domain-containing protein [Mycobacterium sp.]